MLYASASKVYDMSPDDLWQKLCDFVKSSEQSKHYTNCQVTETFVEGFKRTVTFDGEEIHEKAFLKEEKKKIGILLQNHPLFVGETVYQIVAPDKPELADRRVTLCVIMIWRMRPGIIEAPQLGDKQDVLQDLLESIG